MKLLIFCILNRIYSWFKKRIGFVVLSPHEEAIGEFVWSDGGSADGDISMLFRVLPEYEHLLYYNGRRTSYDSLPQNDGCLMVEITPCQQKKLGLVLDEVHKQLANGIHPKARIAGEWAYDGVHEKNATILTYLWHGIWTRPPFDDGWNEIHPVIEIELL